MMFYSILYPEASDEARAMNHPWLTFRSDDKKSGKYTVRGNKIVLAPQGNKEEGIKRPGLYLDLNMDQIMDQVLCHDTDDEMVELFYHFCPDAAMVAYRQEVMRDLEQAEVGSAFRTFLQSMAKAGRLQKYGKEAHHMMQRDKYSVDGMVLYCAAIRQLLLAASGMKLTSQGLLTFFHALRAYVNKAAFIQLEECAGQAKNALEQIACSLRLSGGILHVDFEMDTANYAQAVYLDFDAKAKWGVQADETLLKILPFRQVELSPLEVLVMNALYKKYPLAFHDIHTAAQKACGLYEPFIGRFVKEIRFYFLYLDLMTRLRESGHAFTYPTIGDNSSILIKGAYDMALAILSKAVVPNDFMLSDSERSAVITGANQGGKTTFARSIGQIAVLAALGLPVPCERACLPLYSEIYAQFTQPEDAAVDNGKLKEELLRLKPILQSAGKNSLVILNELFSSATAKDALDMADRTLTLLCDAGAHVVCVTHIDGLCVKHAVSMVAQVQKESGQRLYKILRAEADGKAYVNEIALRHHLTFAKIKERIGHGV